MAGWLLVLGCSGEPPPAADGPAPLSTADTAPPSPDDTAPEPTDTATSKTTDDCPPEPDATAPATPPARLLLGDYDVDDDIRIEGHKAGLQVGETLAAGDFDGDGVTDLLLGGDAMSFVVTGPITQDGSIADAAAVLVGDVPLDFQLRDPAGDLDGDGAAEILVHATGVGGDLSTTYLVKGPYLDEIDIIAAATATLEGTTFGTTMQAAGGFDLDGDGLDDFVLANDDHGNGRVHLVTDDVQGTMKAEDAAVASYSGDSAEHILSLGSWVAVPGDMDGDGRPDLVIGAEGYTSTPDLPSWETDWTGAAFVVHDPPLGDHVITDIADATLYGELPDQSVGHFVDPAGDTNADGYADFLVSTGDYGLNAGEVWLELSPSCGTSIRKATTTLTSAEGGVTDLERGLGVGDVDGDGYGDVSVSVPFENVVYLLYGPLPQGTSHIEEIADAAFSGAWINDHVGDIDGDGYADVGIGSPKSSYHGIDSGAAFILRGGQL